VKKNKVVSTVTCPVGKTLVMAGADRLTEAVAKSGVPYLRKVPVLQWLFSERMSTLRTGRC